MDHILDHISVSFCVHPIPVSICNAFLLNTYRSNFDGLFTKNGPPFLHPSPTTILENQGLAKPQVLFLPFFPVFRCCRIGQQTQTFGLCLFRDPSEIRCREFWQCRPLTIGKQKNRNRKNGKKKAKKLDIRSMEVYSRRLRETDTCLFTYQRENR